MKSCTKCLIKNSLKEFSVKRGKRDSICKECRKLYSKQWYIDNNELQKKKLAIRRDSTRKEIIEFVRKLKDGPCMDCHIKYPYWVMQFDHLRDKELGISEMVNHGYSKDKLEKEIAKCELVCANCHCTRTHNRFKNEYVMRIDNQKGLTGRDPIN